MSQPVCSVTAARLRQVFLGNRTGQLRIVVEGEQADLCLHFFLDKPEEQKPKLKGGRLAARAGILCGEGAFVVFMEAADKEEAAQKLRERCGVQSRAELDHNPAAAEKLSQLAADYEIWLRT